ncbi:MAG: hypothetical protein DMD64_16920, partial [Gemmatimonadetes bacterium]
SSNIRIRGAGSLSGGYAPVFYVDGVRIESGVVEGASTFQGGTALDFLNPDDIESIEVIKGPAAATLYGADAANGVIQIITKKGRRGAEAVQWTASFEAGNNEWTRSVGSNKTYWRCTVAQQTNTSFPGCRVAAGNLSPDSLTWWGKDADGRAQLYSGIPAGDIIDVGDGTFILKDDPLFRHPAALRVGHSKSLNLSARGGTGSMGYFLSFNRDDEQGVFFNNFANRIGGRGNFDVQLSATTDVSLQFGYTQTHLRQPLANNSSNSVNRNAMRGKARATRDPWEPGFLGFSPYVSNEFDDQNRLERMTVGITGNWIPIPWFRNRVTLGLDRQSYDETTFERIDTTGRAPWGTVAATGTITHEIPTIRRWTLDYAGSVTRDLARELNSVSSAGVQLNSRSYRGYFAIGQGLVADNLNLVSAAATRTADEELSKQTSLGMYVQEQVGWRQRLYVTGAVRIDDNSAFGSQFSLVTYPKASIAWLVSDEPFFRNLHLGWADQVKLWQGRQRSRAVRRRPRRLGRPQCRQRRARERARALGVWQSEAQGRDRTRVRDGIRRVSVPRTCWSRVHVLQQAYRGCADQHSRSAFRGIRRQPPREHRGNLEPGRRATALRHTHPGIQVHLGRAALTLGQPQPAGVV